MIAESFEAIIRGGRFDGERVTFSPVKPGTPLVSDIIHKGVKLTFLAGPVPGEVVIDEETGLEVLVEFPR